MKVSTNMEWARPYIEATRPLVPLDTTSFRGYLLRAGVTADGWASIIKEPGAQIKINIRLNEPGGGLLYLEELFVALAHELAHLKHWEHTPAHLALTARILQRFARVARTEGVKNTYGRLKRKRRI